MRSYFRVTLRAKSIYAKEFYDGGFIGTHCGINQDLSKELPEYWRNVNAKFRDSWLQSQGA
jgi:restriction system protein